MDFDFSSERRAVSLRLLGGRAHYETVVRAVIDARHSVWIATANLKELMVEDGRAVPGRARSRSRRSYRSVVGVFDELARRGVDLRILHSGPPSRRFRAEFEQHPVLTAGGLALRLCPRSHFKAVIVDGALLYLGSANWTGAGLGAKGVGRRNFELGIVTEDDTLLDQVQALYDQLWNGRPCQRCRLREVCPAPLDLRTDRETSDPAQRRLPVLGPPPPGGKTRPPTGSASAASPRRHRGRAAE
jgi:phosphatidylserine/phosphatidylglycerophosphate/cardiolipin synthase-like enzyme